MDINIYIAQADRDKNEATVGPLPAQIPRKWASWKKRLLTSAARRKFLSMKINIPRASDLLHEKWQVNSVSSSFSPSTDDNASRRNYQRVDETRLCIAYESSWKWRLFGTGIRILRNAEELSWRNEMECSRHVGEKYNGLLKTRSTSKDYKHVI